jgi:hypothetical protein
MVKTTWRVAIRDITFTFSCLLFFLFIELELLLHAYEACMHTYIPCPFCCVTEGVVHILFALPLLLLL